MTPTNQSKTIHPIFRDVKRANIDQIKQEQTLLVLRLRHEGNSYTQIARRLYAEFNIPLTSQQVGTLCKKYYEKYLEEVNRV